MLVFLLNIYLLLMNFIIFIKNIKALFKNTRAPPFSLVSKAIKTGGKNK